MKKFISISLALIMAFTMLTPFCSFADEINSNEIYLTAEDMQNNAYLAIENALKQAKIYATDSAPYTIYVPSGSYSLDKGLHIYSNTTLHLEKDTFLTRSFESGNMLKFGVKEERFTGYDGYKNINIYGGVWDSQNYDSSCAFRFAHARNVTITDVTIENVKNSHHMELAGVKDLTISGCTFTGFERTKNVTGEGIQIDILHGTDHFPDYYEYDDTPCKNITITNCIFDNLFAGVGTRSGVVGSYFKNINITNNTFNGIVDKAIAAFNYYDCKITDNVINNATVGVMFEYYPTKNLATRLYMPNDKDATITLKNACKTTIANNKINIARNSGYNYPTGIFVAGGINDSSSRVTKGDYSVKGINIKNNSITTNLSSAVGIQLEHVISSKITSNTINSTINSSASGNGVNQKWCDNNTFSKNKISGAYNNSFSFREGTKGSVLSSNTAQNALEHAVYVEKGSTASINSTNKLSSKKTAILVDTKTLVAPGKAKPSKLKLNKSKKPVISWEKVKNASGYELYRSTSKSGKYTLVNDFKSGKAASFTDKNTKKGKTYYYKLVAYKSINGTRAYAKNSSVKSIKCK